MGKPIPQRPLMSDPITRDKMVLQFWNKIEYMMIDG